MSSRRSANGSFSPEGEKQPNGWAEDGLEIKKQAEAGTLGRLACFFVMSRRKIQHSIAILWQYCKSQVDTRTFLCYDTYILILALIAKYGVKT